VRTGKTGLRGTVVEPGFHTTLVKFARTLFTVEIDCLIGATFSADITFHIGELTTLAECAERYRTDTTIGSWDGYHSQPGRGDMKRNLVLSNHSRSDCLSVLADR
jgi:hypothetical protein